MNIQIGRADLILWLVPALALGCIRGSGPTNQSDTVADLPLIADSARLHDFGDVIVKAGQRFEHRFVLANHSGRTVRIAEVINRKPCCGSIRTGRMTLEPGDSTAIDLTLVVAQTMGEVDHTIEVVTDLPGDSTILLRTTAQAHPEFSVERADESADRVICELGAPRRMTLRAVARGSAASPPANLADMSIGSSVPIAWDGPKSTGPADGGLIAESRPFTVLCAADEAGERRAEVRFGTGAEPQHHHLLAWEVVAPLVATPKMLVLAATSARSTVLIRSRDGRSFRVVRVEGAPAGCAARAVRPDAAPQHVVAIDGTATRGSKGVVSVVTDHPRQLRLELAFVVLD